MANKEKLNLETLTTIDECLAAIGQYPAQAVEISAKLAELAEAKGRAEAKAKQPRVAKVKAERTISEWLAGNPGEALGVIANEVARQLSIPASDTAGYTAIIAAIGFQFGAVMTAGGGTARKPRLRVSSNPSRARRWASLWTTAPRRSTKPKSSPPCRKLRRKSTFSGPSMPRRMSPKIRTGSPPQKGKTRMRRTIAFSKS